MNVTDMAWKNMKSMTKDISDKESLSKNGLKASAEGNENES